jgi:hypothetical protein
VISRSERTTVDGATGLQPLVPPVCRAKHSFGPMLAALLLAFSLAPSGSGEGAQAPKKQLALATQTVSFGPVVPGRLGAPASVTVPFSLPISQATAALGYRVTAISAFAFTPAMPAAGGKSVTAADLLVGVANVSSTLGTNGSAAIATGFDYDPTAVRSAGGASTSSGTAALRATIADLLPGREILHAERSTGGAVPAAGGNLTFNLRIAVPTQFFTPGSFSGTISVIVSQ